MNLVKAPDSGVFFGRPEPAAAARNSKLAPPKAVISLLAGEIAFLLISRMAVPVLDFMACHPRAGKEPPPGVQAMII